MDLKIYKEADLIWKKAGSKAIPKELKLEYEVDLLKNMLQLFNVGPYYYAIFNYGYNDFEFVSTEVEKLTGYAVNDYSVPFLLSKVHPDDLTSFLNFENQAIDFLTSISIDRLCKYKIRHDYRVKKKNGEYIRILQQGIVIEHDNDGRILRTLVIHTDISDFEPSSEVQVLSYIGIEGQPSYINIGNSKANVVGKKILSKREKEVLALLMKGFVSKEISSMLNIKKDTVDKHRKNMIFKMRVKNTNELIAKSKSERLI